MIRVMLGSALPVLGLGLAAAFVAPALNPTSRVQPMIVGAADPVAEFQPASFDKPGCASPLLLAESADLPGGAADLRVIALLPRPGSGEAAFELREVPAGAPADNAVTLFLVEANLGHCLAADGSGGPNGDQPFKSMSRIAIEKL